MVKVRLNQNQFDALVSFVFNVGVYGFRDSSLLHLLNEGKYDDAANEFLRWNKVRVGNRYVVSEGLGRRRRLERLLFLELPKNKEN